MDVRRSFCVVLASLFFSGQVLAQSRSYLANPISDEGYKTAISEYFYNKAGTDVLRPVKLLGLVNRPGIYHVPADTNLSTLLSIAGGTDKSANLQEINISNPDGKSATMDLNQQLQIGKDIGLRPNDIIYIPEKKHMFDQPTTNGVMVITTILSLALTTYVVFKK